MFEIHEGIAGPEFTAQFFPRDDVPGVPKQNNQDTKGLLLQLDLDAKLAEFACAQVRFQRDQSEYFLAGLTPPIRNLCGKSLAP